MNEPNHRFGSVLQVSFGVVWMPLIPKILFQSRWRKKAEGETAGPGSGRI